MRVYVDSNHAGDLVTQRSRTGFIVFLNNAPIYWSSKKQSSCKSSTFGSEFVAMKQATEYVCGLRFKLRMMGITVDEPAFVFGDNQSVLANTTAPTSTLKKKSNAIAYHFVREGCARDEWRTAYINTHDNVADLLTKPLPSGEKRTRFIRMLLHHIWDVLGEDYDGPFGFEPLPAYAFVISFWFSQWGLYYISWTMGAPFLQFWNCELLFG